MSTLASALNWYHKKIGAYDKKLWEKSVDQRILRGVCAIPRKTTRIKTELIDVDLVQGSAFAKAKPQHSWVVTTLCGIKRIFLLPFYYSWWQLQTNTKISWSFIVLYFLQISALYLFFVDDSELPDIPVFEVVTPVAIMLILGIMHSQIVATFSSQKSRKHIARTKRRRLKNKYVKKTFYEHDKSSPDSASDYKLYNCEKNNSSQSAQEFHEKQYLYGTCVCDNKECCTCQDPMSKNQTCANYLNCNVHSTTGLIQSDSIDDCKNFKDRSSINPDVTVQVNTKFRKIRKSSEESYISQLSKDSSYTEYDCCVVNSCEFHSSNASSLHSAAKSENVILENQPKDSVFQLSVGKDDNECSSGEDYFVAKKPSYTKEQWKNYLIEIRNSYHVPKKSCSKKQCLQSLSNLASRRYSDVGSSVKLKQTFSILQEHRHSVDNIYAVKSSNGKFSMPVSPVKSAYICDKNFKPNLSLGNIQSLIEPSINIKKSSTSCDSGENSSCPNSPVKNQTSDLEWPLITNTDCNSDTIGCSSECSKKLSDVTPAENPFAWEILERSKKLFNKESADSSRISCTIWEGNECKKADLTALDISSAIIQKVDSAQHCTQYLYIGVLFAAGLSLLPLLFRLKDGISSYDMHDIKTDVSTLLFPTTEEVIKISANLIELMLGKGLRSKIIISIVMLERFLLSFALFFLLSVAEKTFKQRFLYAKHFCYLTSSRGAKRSDLPHFRLNKVKNIKIWLSIRSYMKKLGPQRSVDVIVSITFILEVCVVSYLCVQLLKETGQFADQLHCWELMYWTVALGIFLLRFMIIGTKINKKYRNLSVLITEQINLYLHMEQKPHKKEELILANNVLKLAADLLKELESPFKISGICANSYLYNVTKIIVLSAFSAMLTDILGFKLKLYKIKIK